MGYPIAKWQNWNFITFVPLRLFSLKFPPDRTYNKLFLWTKFSGSTSTVAIFYHFKKTPLKWCFRGLGLRQNSKFLFFSNHRVEYATTFKEIIPAEPLKTQIFCFSCPRLNLGLLTLKSLQNRLLQFQISLEL